MLNDTRMNKHKVNTYLATLIITIAGAAAAMVIVKVSNRNTNDVVRVSSEASYSKLQDAILKSNPNGTFTNQSGAQ